MSGHQSMQFGERTTLKKRFAVQQTVIQARNRLRVRKFCRNTGRLKEETPWVHNTMDVGGIDHLLELMGGTHGEHLDAADTWIGVGNANPIIGFLWTRNPADAGPTPTSDTHPDPSWSMLWQFEDNSATARSNLNFAELHFLDPEGAAGNQQRINNINGAWGNKPTDENWHWQMILEFYSTNAKFQATGLLRLLDLITGNSATHIDTSDAWFRPFTSADSGLGATGENPISSVVTIGTDRIIVTFEAGPTEYNGAWDKVEVGIGNTYGSLVRIRYGGCRADGSACGTKVSGETWTYIWELVLAQGAAP